MVAAWNWLRFGSVLRVGRRIEGWLDLHLRFRSVSGVGALSWTSGFEERVSERGPCQSVHIAFDWYLSHAVHLGKKRPAAEKPFDSVASVERIGSTRLQSSMDGNQLVYYAVMFRTSSPGWRQASVSRFRLLGRACRRICLPDP